MATPAAPAIDHFKAVPTVRLFTTVPLNGRNSGTKGNRHYLR
jgi:hypothetical protein